MFEATKVLTVIPKTEWVVDGNDDTEIELQGHKFAARDTGGPMLCSMLCSAQGRHVHIDFCRSLSPRDCRNPEILHITTAIRPMPKKSKDWITHKLHWQRLGMCSWSFHSIMLTQALSGFKGDFHDSSLWKT
jgi:hypothetical protein